VNAKNERDDLSLVMPTRNRPTYLRRLFTYYKSRSMPYPFIVADSSEGSFKTEVLNVIDEFTDDLNIKFRSYDPEIPPGKKFTDALALVETPFFCQEQDDDFHIPDWFSRGLDFLRYNPEFMAVHGDTLVLRVAKDSAFGPLEYVTPLRGQRTLEQGTGSERILAYMRDYLEINQSIHRTDVHRRNWEKAESTHPDLPFTELTPNCLAVIQGKVMKLPGLFTVRQWHFSQTSRVHSTTLDWLATSEWSAQYGRFRECLASALSEQDSIPLETARATVHGGFGSLVGDWLAQTHKKPEEPQPIKPQSPLRAFLKRIPGVHKSWCLARDMVRPPPPPPTLLSGASQYLEDFMPIYEAITGKRESMAPVVV
jgi:glycosyltransferase domain-containing protein